MKAKLSTQMRKLEVNFAGLVLSGPFRTAASSRRQKFVTGDCTDDWTGTCCLLYIWILPRLQGLLYHIQVFMMIRNLIC